MSEVKDPKGMDAPDAEPAQAAEAPKKLTPEERAAQREARKAEREAKKAAEAAAASGSAAPATAAKTKSAAASPEDASLEPPAPEPPGLPQSVAPSPHVVSGVLTTHNMMRDVLLALSPTILVAIWVFGWAALFQIAICAGAAAGSEYALTRMRGRPFTLNDLSVTVTGVILALTLPWSAPWYVGVIASVIAVGIGKVVFGGLGQNLFNPAMVGRAFVMISFPAQMGAGAYVALTEGLDIISAATPLTAAKQSGVAPDLFSLILGNVNGSLGETSAIACLLGGLYLCLRRTASWEIPAGVLVGAGLSAIIGDVVAPDAASWLDHLLSGGMLFGAFFIATDPVTSPLTPKGKWIFGIGVGALVMLLRGFSGYPEGMMFAVLLMNAVVPLINRNLIPTPMGGPVPTKKA